MDIAIYIRIRLQGYKKRVTLALHQLWCRGYHQSESPTKMMTASTGLKDDAAAIIDNFSFNKEDFGIDDEIDCK
ncbi:hypothetical protein AVEN_46260-1 [Araneus ventricosus]|uniref:Uncharacterized protein n=1 Tax=Araneus ventricosus TaxID=182803 RepID=A0A4Y2FC33_ARAVE|nr:hypothetical protein AVEN_46260-1 [Araneus ventricosus]